MITSKGINLDEIERNIDDTLDGETSESMTEFLKEKRGRTLCIGDIHGGFKGMIQALERAGFNPKFDTLISLGDIADGWSETPECVEYLLGLPNLIAVRGNHDKWCQDWLNMAQAPSNWTQQGGQSTIDAYVRTGKLTDDRHREFFKNQVNYYVDDENRAFVHGGYTSRFGLGHEQYQADYYWNRDLWSVALSGHNQMKNKEALDQRMPRTLRPHKEIFIGHTSTVNWDTDKPMNKCNVWNLDTGGGYYGKITVMDVETKEYFQSDLLKDLYSNEKGR